MKKKILIVGSDRNSIYEISDLIEGQKSKHHPGQNLLYRKETILVPDIYLKNSWKNNIIIVIGQNQTNKLLFIRKLGEGTSYYSPNFAKSFSLPSLGIVYGIDQHTKQENIDIERKILKDAGVDLVVDLNINDSISIENFLDKVDMRDDL